MDDADKDWFEFKGLGGRLERERVSRKLSRAKLAELAGVNQNSLAKWEKAGQPGGKYPPLPKLTRLCKILEIDPREVFDTVFQSEEFQHDPNLGGGIPFNNPDYFSFKEHFATDLDWTGWSLEVQDIESLNSHLGSIAGELHYYGQRLRRLEQALNENGPDQEDPGRPSQNPSEAVGAAADQTPRKEKDQP